MPLHLLGKKSWNVYNPTAIARVRADEAAAAQAEGAQEQRLRDYEAERRLAVLRGQSPSSLAPPPQRSPTPPLTKRRREDVDDVAALRKKRARKLLGEDDTDRDIRLARVEEEGRVARRDQGVVVMGAEKKAGGGDVVKLTDHAGHIQLFAPPSTGRIRAAKNEEAEREKKDKERAFEDQYTMRFSNAAGFGKAPDKVPWYAKGYTGTEERDGQQDEEGDGEAVGKNAFGRVDPGRGGRDQARLVNSDPMAAMKAAQRKLKEVGRRKEEEARERAWVVEQTGNVRGHWDVDGDRERGERRHKEKRRQHRSRSRDRSPHRHSKSRLDSSGRRRSKSPDGRSTCRSSRRRSTSRERTRCKP